MANKHMTKTKGQSYDQDPYSSPARQGQTYPNTSPTSQAQTRQDNRESQYLAVPTKNLNEEEYQRRFRDYHAELVWHNSNLHSSDNESIDVRLRTKDGNEYLINFATRNFLNKMFKKNKITGECESGTYFAMPNMIIVNRIDQDTITTTIDDLIDRLALHRYLEEI